MTLDLTHLETLLAAATPGPWELAGPDKNWIWAVLSSTKMPLTWFARYYPKAFSREDTEALVALRNAAPALIARVRKLEEQLAKQRQDEINFLEYALL